MKTGQIGLVKSFSVICRLKDLEIKNFQIFLESTNEFQA